MKVTLSRLVAYGAVPPVTVIVTVPSLALRQVSLPATTDAASTAVGSFTVTLVNSTIQPIASRTLIVYDPTVKPVKVFVET